MSRLPRSRSSLLTLSIREWRTDPELAYSAESLTERKAISGTHPYYAIGKKRATVLTDKENMIMERTQQAPPGPSSCDAYPVQLLQPQEADSHNRLRGAPAVRFAKALQCNRSDATASLDHSSGNNAEHVTPSAAQLVWVDCYFYGFWLEESKISGYRDSVLSRSSAVRQ
eukprot:CAMPEP_0119380202 /NCGR_PEP_ID=MMETSP1334-20130426/56004_1 /TAXON_ID=127549 /ORGANISM="Calcidiscus leptoporus, Strain RCC1130" /LENGTH=169 /DNA_ID=CAMNT_0007399947 /DNA_START=11 /DNA_END=520 /DNA_ORIENTATION=+